MAVLVTLLVLTTLVVCLAGSSSQAGSSPRPVPLDSQSSGSFVAVAFASQGGGWETTASGIVAAFGGAPSYGSLRKDPVKPIVGMAAPANGRGYWLVASDGGVFTFGNAAFYGSTGELRLNKPIVGIAATPNGRGYWLVASDGGVFTFGNAAFYGSTGKFRLNNPIDGIAATPNGRGYWLVGSDGGVFAFGDAAYYGSTANVRLNAPIVGIATTSDGKGYWLVGSDGGIFNAGDARFYGSGPTEGIKDRIIGVIPTRNARGYTLFGRTGMSYLFGDATPRNADASMAAGSSSGSTTSPSTSSTSSTSTTSTTSTTTTTSPPGTTSEFVGRSGTTLTLNGSAYRFAGINIYMAASGGTPSSCGGELYPNVGVPLSDMPSGIVIRFWAFQDFFVSNGSFDWDNFDQVLAIAADHGDKVIPVLANQYDYCDGPAKDLDWYQTGYQSTVEPGDLVTYRQYVADIVQRYADNPTIAMWQLVNEGQALNPNGSCNESAALSALLSFSNDVGGIIHKVDPNHLVSLGTPEGYSGGGGGDQWCGAANSDYQTLMASSGNDVCDYHDYGYPTDPMGIPSPLGLSTAIQMCHADNKPIMVGETGIYADNPSELAARAADFDAKFSAQFQAGVVGELLWCWVVKPEYVTPDADPDYGISANDPALGILGSF